MGARVLGLVVNYNGGNFVEQAVESLLAQTCPTDILVVDNASSDCSGARLAERFERDKRVRVALTGANLGYAAATNWALGEPDYDYYFFLNPDAVAPPDAVETFVSIMDRHSNLGIVGCAIVEYDAENLVQSFAIWLDLLLYPVGDRHAGLPTAALPATELSPTFYAMGAAMFVRGSSFRLVGGCDSDFFMFADEADLSWRMRLRGLETMVTPRVHVRHVGGYSSPHGLKNGDYHTSLRRIYLRERNSFRMAIKCFSTPLLIIYTILNITEMLVEATLLTMLSKRRLAAVYTNVIRDVWRERSLLLKKRRHIQATRQVSDLAILVHLRPYFNKVLTLLRYGVPNISDFAKAGQTE